MKLFVGAKGVVHYKGKVLLVREATAYKDGSKAARWDVVGGRIEAGERVRDGLLREIREESGLSITPGELLGVFDGFPMIRGEECHVVRIYFLCEADTDAVTLSDDHDAYEWVDPKAVNDKELVDDIAEMLAAYNERMG